MIARAALNAGELVYRVRDGSIARALAMFAGVVRRAPVRDDARG